MDDPVQASVDPPPIGAEIAAAIAGMDAGSLLNSLLTMWVAITIVFAGLQAWRSLLCMRPDNTVILNASESGMPAEHVALSVKIESIGGCSRVLGYISLLLLTGVIAAFVHRAATALSHS